MGQSHKSKGGRPLKTDKIDYRISVNFTADEHARFLTMYEKSGVYSKAAFIKARVFNESFRVVKTDRAALEYVAKLSQFHAQFRAVGVNYNQVVRQLHIHFSQRNALAMLYKLEKITAVLAGIGQEVIRLCDEFRQRP